MWLIFLDYHTDVASIFAILTGCIYLLLIIVFSHASLHLSSIQLPRVYSFWLSLSLSMHSVPLYHFLMRTWLYVVWLLSNAPYKSFCKLGNFYKMVISKQKMSMHVLVTITCPERTCNCHLTCSKLPIQSLMFWCWW